MFRFSIDDHLGGVPRLMCLAAVATGLVAWSSTIAMASVFPLHAHCSKWEAWALAIMFAVSVSVSLYSLMAFEASYRELMKVSLPLITNHMFLFLYFDLAYMTGCNLLPDTSVDVMMAIASPLTIALSFRQSQIMLKSDGDFLET